ncbi:hypothetical protein [Thalassoglobus neptunius]|uniref:hypothetical protein n=1 Tax=Thalassoglobus neptunius TaxID=1938619 RepID=UPI001E3D40A8|nr:hypothetical protein [Thalassoglobus neptunius]
MSESRVIVIVALMTFVVGATFGTGFSGSEFLGLLFVGEGHEFFITTIAAEANRLSVPLDGFSFHGHLATHDRAMFIGDRDRRGRLFTSVTGIGRGRLITAHEGGGKQKGETQNRK